MSIYIAYRRKNASNALKKWMDKPISINSFIPITKQAEPGITNLAPCPVAGAATYRDPIVVADLS